MGSPKIARGSLYSISDQERLYREMMGNEKTERQVKAANLERGKCICQPQVLKRKWEGDRLTNRTVHGLGCPKRKPWMDLVTEL